MAPVGTQVEVTCKVDVGYSVVFVVELPDENGSINTLENGVIDHLSSRGIETELYNSTLTISNGTINDQTTVQCRAVNASNISQRCDGEEIATITFYGNVDVMHI